MNLIEEYLGILVDNMRLLYDIGLSLLNVSSLERKCSAASRRLSSLLSFKVIVIVFLAPLSVLFYSPLTQ